MSITEDEFHKVIKVFHSQVIGSNNRGNSLNTLVKRLESKGVRFISVDERNKPLGWSANTQGLNHIAVTPEGSYIKITYDAPDYLTGNFSEVEILKGKDMISIDLRDIRNNETKRVKRLPNGIRQLINYVNKKRGV